MFLNNACCINITPCPAPAGFCQLLEVVLNKCGTLSGSQFVNSHGRTPLHEVACSKGKPSDALFDLLLKAGVDPKVKDKNQKTALEYCIRAGRDWTYSKLNDYQRAFEKERKEGKENMEKEEKKVSQGILAMPKEQKDVDACTHHIKPHVEQEPVLKEPDVKSSTVQALVDMSVKMVKMNGLREQPLLPAEDSTSALQVLDKEDSFLDDDSWSLCEEVEETFNCGQLIQSDHVHKKQPDMQGVSQGDFDGLTWEVDCTKKFWKQLGGLPEFLRRKAITVIQRLASGEWHSQFQRCMGGEQASEVYSLKLTKEIYLIWQKAIDYSARYSKGMKKVVYSEIIRMWDVVKHKDIHHSVDYVTDSLRKGRCSHMKYVLQQFEPTKEHQETKEHIPRLFVCGELKQDLKDAVFSPSALPGQRDYNVITFYAFSSALVQSILSSGNHRQDFPFKGWPEEHDIISLQEGQAILLLGRSGTGKTTCCVYRLWNQCSMYWKMASEPCIKRVSLPYLKQAVVPMDDGDLNSTYPVQERQPAPPPVLGAAPIVSDDKRKGKVVDWSGVQQEDWCQSWMEQVKSASHRVAAAQEATPTEVDATQEDKICLDHLRQVFITRNPILVSQVKQKFYDLVAGTYHMKEHLTFETASLPPTLQKVPDGNYPLFLTVFQWLNLIDASLGDGDYFLPRSDEGILLIEPISSTGEFNTSRDVIELFDDFENKEEVHAVKAGRRETQRSGANVWRIVDREYFCDVIWQHITKRFIKLWQKFDPVLIWMEIRSVLKGSYEALMSGNGHLDKAEYEKIGPKRASNFSLERTEVYKLFMEYEKYLSKNQLIDQCDWVFHLFSRLIKQSEVLFVIHEVYVDEVQDFTEAELYLIMHCCRFPSGLFFTGDSAQSIMHGVSFRFQDLNSLFYHYSARGAKKTLLCRFQGEH